MINQMKRLFVLLAAIMFLLASCSTTKMSYYESIPDDAVAHVSMNFEKMAKKINGKEVLASFIYKQFIREIQEDNSKAAAFVDDFFKNPENSGIDFSTDAGFFYMKTPDNNNLLFCLNIKDYGKFDDFIHKLFKLAEVEDIKKDDGFQYMSEDETFFCWNESYVIHFIPEEVSNPDKSLSYIRKIMKGEVENPITKNKDFMEFCGNKKDLNGWISDKIVDDEETRKSAEELFGAPLDNSFIHAYLSFNKEDITLTAELKANEEMKKANVFKELMKKGIDKKVLTHLPGPELGAVLSLAINPAEIYNRFLKEEDTQEIDATFSAMANMTLQDVVNSFGGDIVILVSGFQKPSGGGSMIGLEIIEGYEPRITVAISLNKKDFFETIIKSLPPEFVKEIGDFYEVNIDGLIVHTAVIDGVWLITNDTEIVKKGAKGFVKNNLSGSDIADPLMQSSYMFHFDAREKSVQEFLTKVADDKKDWTTLKKYLQYISLYFSNDLKYTLKIGINPVNDNSLESLFELLNTYIEEDEKNAKYMESPMN